MRVLLDTHALLWFLLDDPALSRAARELIRTPEMEEAIPLISADQTLDAYGTQRIW